VVAPQRFERWEEMNEQTNERTNKLEVKAGPVEFHLFVVRSFVVRSFISSDRPYEEATKSRQTT
jgi:hypothetical protein